DSSADGGLSWIGPSVAASNIHVPPLTGAGYVNTTFEDGIEETFAVGNHPTSTGHYPIYVAYESKSTGFGNILLTASYDQGRSWTTPIQVNSSIQFYTPVLKPIAHNIRLTAHNWDPQLNSPDRRCPCDPTDTFIGDYFGNDFAGTIDYSTFVSTYDDGGNRQHYQQQVVATVSPPKR